MSPGVPRRQGLRFYYAPSDIRREGYAGVACVRTDAFVVVAVVRIAIAFFFAELTANAVLASSPRRGDGDEPHKERGQCDAAR